MLPPIQRLTVLQFAQLLASARLHRDITAVHLHHTWRPRHSDFRGQSTIEAMRLHHTGLGWHDMAQHLTIDPMGECWTGRNWNAPPASHAGDNGTSAAGPFMIELVGDFDLGADPFAGPQRATAVAVVAHLLHRFGLTPPDLHFHRELGASTTCPGSGIDRAELTTAVAAALKALDAAQAAAPAKAGKTSGKASAKTTGEAAARAPFASQSTLGFAVTQPWAATAEENRTVPETRQAADRIDALSTVSGAGAVTRAVDEWAMLRPHVINLTRGRLSQGGRFRMPPGSLEGIIDGFKDYVATTARPRLMVHAHGGLVSEGDALAYAQSAVPWWTTQGVYPVFFVWETGVFDVIRQRLGSRGPIGDARDFLFEQTASVAAAWAWGDMKESARMASQSDTGEGHPGGAWLFAALLETLAGMMPAGKPLDLHLVGHSAGAIFHSHFIPELMHRKLPVASLSVLAPAVRNDVFTANVVPHLGKAPGIGRLTMCTMSEDAERDDDLVEFLGATVYGKSLLYLVSRAFEPKRKTPLLGLDETLRTDATLWPIFQAGGPARLELSEALGATPNPNTRALHHGDFDNDAATMRTVAGIVTGQVPPHDFPFSARRAATEARRRSLRSGAPMVAPHPWGDRVGGSSAGETGSADPQTTGRRLALCVGIDQYASNPLAGCVADARAWSAQLSSLGFSVSTLLDGDATRGRILDALMALTASARAGDTLVFQYAGHGTQVADLNGDERDGFDEALVPIDYDSGALLLDDDLADVYAALAPGASLTLFMDCCHSGTNSRFAPREAAVLPSRVRRRFLALSPWQEQAHRAFRSRLTATASRAGSTVLSANGVVHMAACQDDQYAYEVDGAGNFTRVATAALAEAVRRAETNEAFMERVAQAVSALGNPQTPGLMRLPASLRHRPIFGGTAGRPAVGGAPPHGAAATMSASTSASALPGASSSALSNPAGAAIPDAVAYHLAEALRLLGGRP